MASFRLVLSLLVASIALDVTSAGILDIFNTTSDYNLVQSLNIVFGQTKNDISFLLTGEDKTPIERAVTFWCGHSNSTTLKQTLLDDPDLGSKLNLAKPIAFLTHGWLDNTTRVWFRKTVQDMIKFGDSNVCGVNWARLAQYDYRIAAVKHVPIVSGYLTKFITFLLNSGMPLDNVTLVGHSMGAQISGQVGLNFNGKIPQIFGLDPAGPMFTAPVDRGLRYRLDKSDAKYVQMIITSRGTIGVRVGDGHENFYPNGGDAPMPNCVLPLTNDAEFFDQIMCSHLHATSLYRFSLNPALVYNARRCLNYGSYRLGLCSLNKTNRLGVYSDRSGGDFYMRTGAASPYDV